MIPPPVGLLETERLLLRPVEAEDNIFMFALRSDAEVNKYVPITPPEHIFEMDAFIKKIQNNQAERKSDLWIIVLKETGRAIGTITLWQYDWEKREAEIGFTLMKEYWQKGIMKEAAKIVFAIANNYSSRLDTQIQYRLAKNTAGIKYATQS